MTIKNFVWKNEIKNIFKGTYIENAYNVTHVLFTTIPFKPPRKHFYRLYVPMAK